MCGKRLADFEAQLHSTERSAELLSELLAHIRHSSHVFDQEDASRVEDSLARKLEELEALRTSYEQDETRLRERERVVTSMHAAIEERPRVLEEGNDALGSDPQLLQYFAKKQLSLRELLGSQIKSMSSAP